MARFIVQLQLPTNVKAHMNPIEISLAGQPSAAAAQALVERALEQSTGIPGLLTQHKLLFTNEARTRFIEGSTALQLLLQDPDDTGPDLQDCMSNNNDDDADFNQAPSCKLHLNLNLPKLGTCWQGEFKAQKAQKKRKPDQPPSAADTDGELALGLPGAGKRMHLHLNPTDLCRASVPRDVQAFKAAHEEKAAEARAAADAARAAARAGTFGLDAAERRDALKKEGRKATTAKARAAGPARNCFVVVSDASRPMAWLIEMHLNVMAVRFARANGMQEPLDQVQKGMREAWSR